MPVLVDDQLTPDAWIERSPELQRLTGRLHTLGGQLRCVYRRQRRRMRFVRRLAEAPVTLHVAHAGVHPFNAESPWRAALLPNIPAELHYVRNHGSVPRLDWATHTVRVEGLVDQPQSFSMDELVAKFPKHTVTVTFVCSGNR